ncbi:MAG: hypothetical protein KC561_18925, partial [Myxococcales bacterium]|nr:hypothetical protein [Myxococcales bacterium]
DFRTLSEAGQRMRFVLIFPDNDLFNGSAGDPGRPDASGLRASIAAALGQLSAEEAIELRLGRYSLELDWLPLATAADQTELLAALTDPANFASAGRTTEDPFRGIDLGFSGYVSRPGRNFVTFFIVVTSSLTIHEDDLQVSETRRVGARLRALDAAHVVTLPIVFVPVFDDDTLRDPSGSPVQFAEGVTPDHGFYRLANTHEGFATAISQAIRSAAGAFVADFESEDIAVDGELSFELTLTLPSGEVLTSNVLTIEL